MPIGSRSRRPSRRPGISLGPRFVQTQPSEDDLANIQTAALAARRGQAAARVDPTTVGQLSPQDQTLYGANLLPDQAVTRGAATTRTARDAGVYRERYPELQGLSDEEAVDRGGRRDELALQQRLRRTPTGGSGGKGTTTPRLTFTQALRELRQRYATYAGGRLTGYSKSFEEMYREARTMVGGGDPDAGNAGSGAPTTAPGRGSAFNLGGASSVLGPLPGTAPAAPTGKIPVSQAEYDALVAAADSTYAARHYVVR